MYVCIILSTRVQRYSFTVFLNFLLGLDQLCNDFFLRGKECVDDIEKDTSHQCKRLKSGGQESVDKSCSASGFIRPVPCLSGWGEDVVQLGEYDKATEYNMAAMKDCLDELQGSCAGQGNEQITTKDGQKGGAEKSSEVTSNQDNPTVITDEKGVLSLECTDEGLARHLQDGLNEYKDREDLALDLAIYESFYIGSILEDPRDVAGSPTHSVGQAPDILECNEPEGYIGFLTKHED